jgi:hypothetical protein
VRPERAAALAHDPLALGLSGDRHVTTPPAGRPSSQMNTATITTARSGIWTQIQVNGTKDRETEQDHLHVDHVTAILPAGIQSMPHRATLLSSDRIIGTSSTPLIGRKPRAPAGPAPA